MELTEEQKLQKIIGRAIKRGFDIARYHPWQIDKWSIEAPVNETMYLYMITYSPDGGIIPQVSRRSVSDIIFSHSFLKTFFREKEHKDWEYHARRLVLTPEEGRIDYLYNHKLGKGIPDFYKISRQWLSKISEMLGGGSVSY